MQNTRLDNWELRSGMARSIAASMWGEVNGSYRVARTGAYYYHCAGHGGYVIDPQVLSRSEREALCELLPTVTVYLSVQDIDGVPTVIGQRSEFSNRGVKYNPRFGQPRWVEREVLVAEEDCDWAYVEALTDIRAEAMFYDEDGGIVSDEERGFRAMKWVVRNMRRTLEWERRSSAA
jgi:hypothetical protein